MTIEVTVDLDQLDNGADERPQRDQMTAGGHQMRVFGTSLYENDKGSTVARIALISVTQPNTSMEGWFLMLGDATGAPHLKNLRRLVEIYTATSTALPPSDSGRVTFTDEHLQALIKTEFHAEISFNTDNFIQLTDIRKLSDANAPEMDAGPMPEKFL